MNCQKHLFNLPDIHHYLNCAYLSPLLKTVEEAGIKGIRCKNRPWEITPDQFFEDSNKLRRLFSKVVNVQNHNNIAILPAVSYGMSAVAKNLPKMPGREIILAGEQFPSNVYPWMRFCEEYECELKMVEPPEEFNDRGKNWNRRILEAVTSNTLMVALGNIHWTDGTLFDLKEIGQRVRENDAVLVIDGTQSVGALPFDVHEVKPDALFCAGYKWLMGPYSMALGYFGSRFRDGVPLEEGWITRKDSENFSSLVDYQPEYQSGARRFDVGERSNFILVPMMIEALKQILSWRPGNIQLYCEELTKDLVAILPESGYKIEDPDRRSHHMFGIRLPSHVSADKLEKKCLENNIHISVRGSSVRISPNVYNDDRDVERLTETLVDIAS